MVFIDSIDVGTKTTLLTTSLHWTAASLNQHPTTFNQGESKAKNWPIQRNDKLRKLPTWYTKVKPFLLPTDITMSTCKKSVFSIQADESTLLVSTLQLQRVTPKSFQFFMGCFSFQILRTSCLPWYICYATYHSRWF